MDYKRTDVTSNAPSRGKMSAGNKRKVLSRWHAELSETIGRLEMRLGQLKTEDITRLEAKLKQFRKQRDNLEREMSKPMPGVLRQDEDWDNYRHGIQESYLPKLIAGEISQDEYDVLLDGCEDAIRDFYRNREQADKAEAVELGVSINPREFTD